MGGSVGVGGWVRGAVWGKDLACFYQSMSNSLNPNRDPCPPRSACGLARAMLCVRKRA